MLKIAICEDEPGELEQVCALVEQYISVRSSLDARIFRFSSSAALLSDAAVRGGYDLYLLDVLMPDMNGIDLGLELRKRDTDAQIIYLTVSAEYAVDSYLVHAYHYLLKPVSAENLFPVLDGAVEQLEAPRPAGITVKTAAGLVRLPFRSVVYAELYARAIRYHLADGGIVDGPSVRGAFREAVSPLLADRRFVQSAASFVVNLQYVRGLAHNEMVLSNGGRAPMSRSCSGQVRDCWMNYWLETDET